MAKVFGIALDETMKKPGQKGIPTVTKKVFAFLNLPENIATEGLFRVSAGVKEMNALQQMFDNGEDVDLDKHDPHLVAGLLKSYLIELPEPLFTFDLYDAFIAAGDGGDIPAKLKVIIAKIPEPNALLVTCLFLFLHRVCDHSEQNKMTSTNLAIVFGQILLRPRVESLELLRHAPKITNILKVMIEDYYDLFPRSEEDEAQLVKGELSSIDVLIGVPGSKKKKSKKKRKGEAEAEDLPPEQQKLRNIKLAVDDAIAAVLERLDSMAEDLEGAASLEETIEIAKRVRSAKRILFSNPASAE